MKTSTSTLTAFEACTLREILLDHNVSTLDAKQEFGSSKELNVALDHLRTLLLEMQPDWDKIGREEGLKWAKTATSNEIEYVLNWDIKPGDKGWIDITDDTPEGESIRLYLDDLEVLDSFNILASWGDFTTRGFIQAWKAAVVDSTEK